MRHRPCSLVGSMFSAGLSAGALASAVACAPQREVRVTWTVQDAPAVEACAGFDDPRLVLTLRDEQNIDGDGVRTVDVPCADGEAMVELGRRTELSAAVFDGDVQYGRAPARELVLDPRAMAHEDTPTEALDVHLSRGRLEARFTVAGQSCDAAGVDAFSVTLSRVVGPLDREIVGNVDRTPVPCTDGDARFTFAPVELGSRYELYAEAESSDAQWSTSDGGTGAGARIERLFTVVEVDLDVVRRP